MAVFCWNGAPARAQSGADILRETGVAGGLIVHLGAGDGQLTASLRAGEQYTVHGLDPDPARVAAARAHIRGLGLYGEVSVELFTGKVLPYADNLVNLVVASDAALVSPEEILRVLAPRGVAYVRENGQWSKTVKPLPGNTDEWPHFLHDAGNNAVARDTEVGPPRALQWVAPPLWLRSHETPSGFEALVSAGGRVFYIFDEGLVGITDQRLPERWALLCRDAFNGKLLWRRPLGAWGWPQWAREKFADKDWTTITGGRTVVPDENQRRLVATGSRLYATLEYDAPLAILDAASGEVLATVPETAPARQILAADGVVVVACGKEESAARKKKANKAATEGAADGRLMAVEGDGKMVLWRKQTGAINGLLLAIDQKRVIFQSGGDLAALDLTTGKELWRAKPGVAKASTLVANQGVVLLRAATNLVAHDGATGQPLWQTKIQPSIGIGTHDLYVVDGVVWPGMTAVKEDRTPAAKGAHAQATGYDLKTGKEIKRVFAENLLSPEHHHRCYRNKATTQFLIGAMEGSEFLDLSGTGHSQNNWIRGACKYGIMPGNGLLYVPPDQCFCSPGAKVLGFTAVAARGGDRPPLPNNQRLEKGPAYEPFPAGVETGHPEDWPTFRQNPARHGTSPTALSTTLAANWRVKLGKNLTAPVSVGDRVYVAARDAHTVFAVDARSGRELWHFIAGGRIDSPPTLHQGKVLFGSADGRIYCLRASDGALAWRFLAAPHDRRVANDGQVESAWPAHGSVLLRDGLVYATAGRSTYLDGGIHLWALEPHSGEIRRQASLTGPFPDHKKERDVSFWSPGANSDVLSSEGDFIYLRQVQLSPALQQVQQTPLSSKGEKNTGLHLFSTAGFLDDSWYNRAFWMYAKRWPGFQLANQASKSGQLLVVDAERTYGVNVFYRRNVHSPMFFPGKEGYILFADRNSAEPQIVGEEGARPPVAWLPQSGYLRKEGERKLDSPAFGLDKMIGYTRAEPPVWMLWLPIRIRAMVKAGDALIVAGPPDEFDSQDPYASFEGRKGARLAVVSAGAGQKLAEYPLDTPPVFDGLIAARNRLFLALEDGSLACWSNKTP